ncbi:MAG: acylphosphatase [Phycisphaerae bacterium]|nr:acylphosphatase [Phycisphaerae bacterium]
MIQKRFHFTGDVQGVGFRYTACRIAGGFDITGYVKNVSDGSVECVAEGTAEEIDSFIERLQQTMSGYIRQTTQEQSPATGRWNSFGVGY